MKTRGTVLTEHQRRVLILSALQPGDAHFSNTEIAKRLGLSVNAVKAVIHRACIKLGASNRHEAVAIAVQQGEISIDELLPLSELAKTLGALGPEGLRRMARLVRQGQDLRRLLEIDEQIIPTEPQPDSLLTSRERDVLILAGRGQTNQQIADTLCMTVSAVKKFLNGAAAKLGASKRADIIMLALKQGEIGMGEMYAPNEILQGLARMDAESIEKMAQMLESKSGQ
jgi:DNA-binding NarL/FixJ family response regulator